MSGRPPFDLLAAVQPATAIAALIPVGASTIGGAAVQTTNARDLHSFLGIGKDFSNWIKTQITRARLIEGRDFASSPSRATSGQPTIEYHLTLDAGKHVAMLSETEKGFEVREYFIECERRALTPAADPLAGLPPEQRALIALMVDNVAIKAEQAAQAQVQAVHAAALETVGQRVNEIAAGQVLLTRPSAAESIVHIRVRIGALYGLPARIVDEVVRQSPYALKPVMVKNAHEDAMGGSYACFWIKDVSSVFARFVAECQRVTATQATHPYIEGRFKLTLINRPPNSTEPPSPQAGLSFQ